MSNIIRAYKSAYNYIIELDIDLSTSKTNLNRNDIIYASTIKIMQNLDVIQLWL